MRPGGALWSTGETLPCSFQRWAWQTYSLKSCLCGTVQSHSEIYCDKSKGQCGKTVSYGEYREYSHRPVGYSLKVQCEHPRDYQNLEAYLNQS